MDFCFLDCDCIGWDLDHTMVRYNLANLNPLIFNVVKRYLLEKAHYVKEVEDFKYDEQFAKKGLVLDKLKGNVLKLDSRSIISIAFHGTKKMTEEQIIADYGKQKTIDFHGETTARFWSLTTYFEAPVASIWAQLVDLEDSKHRQKESVSIYHQDYKMHSQVLYDSFYFNYAQWDKGFYFPEVCRNPDKYIIRQKGLKEWLVELKQKHNKFLFLLTNSLPEYTDLLLEYSFGKDYAQLFDIVSVHAKKPTYFTSQNPYYEFQVPSFTKREYPGPEYPVDDKPLTILKPNSGYYYIGGHHSILIDSFRQFSRHDPKKDVVVCYFGDHLRNDVQICKTALSWKTVAIVEELEDIERELGWQLPITPIVRTSTKETKSKTSSIDLNDNNANTSTNSNHPSSNPYWGSFFVAENYGTFSFWASETIEHSDVCVPSVERLCLFPCDFRFTSSATASVNLHGLNAKEIHTTEQIQAEQEIAEKIKHNQ